MIPSGETGWPAVEIDDMMLSKRSAAQPANEAFCRSASGQESAGMAQPVDVRVVESEQLQIPADRRTRVEKDIIRSTFRDNLVQMLQKAQRAENSGLRDKCVGVRHDLRSGRNRLTAVHRMRF